MKTREHARELARFFREVSPRLLAEVRERETLPGTPAIAREWMAMALHACIRGLVERGGDDVAALVDALHDELLQDVPDPDAMRPFLAERYARYDGIVRTLGPKGFAESPLRIARAGAAAMEVADPESFAITVAPLLESLAEGAAATLESLPRLVLPPLEPLRRLAARLDRAAMPWALGASGLLAALGLVTEVHDWDIQVDAPPDGLRALFAGEAFTFHGHGGCHADWKLSFEAERTELISQFAFFSPGGVVKIPLHVSGTWNGLPVAGKEAWACAYWLMGELDEPALRPRRAHRACLLLAHLHRVGADSAIIEQLLEQPLPPRLAARLATLLRARHTAPPGRGRLP